jgi:hypothetical protein
MLPGGYRKGGRYTNQSRPRTSKQLCVLLAAAIGLVLFIYSGVGTVDVQVAKKGEIDVTAETTLASEQDDGVDGIMSEALAVTEKLDDGSHDIMAEVLALPIEDLLALLPDKPTTTQSIEHTNGVSAKAPLPVRPLNAFDKGYKQQTTTQSIEHKKDVSTPAVPEALSDMQERDMDVATEAQLTLLESRLAKGEFGASKVGDKRAGTTAPETRAAHPQQIQYDNMLGVLMDYLALDPSGSGVLLVKMKTLSRNAKPRFIKKLAAKLVAAQTTGAATTGARHRARQPSETMLRALMDYLARNPSNSEQWLVQLSRLSREQKYKFIQKLAEKLAQRIQYDTMLGVLMDYLALDPSGSGVLLVKMKTLSRDAKPRFIKKLAAKLLAAQSTGARHGARQPSETMLRALMDYLARNPSNSEHLLVELSTLSREQKYKFMQKLDAKLVYHAAKSNSAPILMPADVIDASDESSSVDDLAQADVIRELMEYLAESPSQSAKLLAQAHDLSDRAKVTFSKKLAAQLAGGKRIALPSDTVLSALMGYLSRDPRSSERMFVQLHALSPRAKRVFIKKFKVSMVGAAAGAR